MMSIVVGHLNVTPRGTGVRPCTEEAFFDAKDDFGDSDFGGDFGDQNLGGRTLTHDRHESQVKLLIDGSEDTPRHGGNGGGGGGGGGGGCGGGGDDTAAAAAAARARREAEKNELADRKNSCWKSCCGCWKSCFGCC